MSGLLPWVSELFPLSRIWLAAPTCPLWSLTWMPVVRPCSTSPKSVTAVYWMSSATTWLMLLPTSLRRACPAVPVTTTPSSAIASCRMVKSAVTAPSAGTVTSISTLP